MGMFVGQGVRGWSLYPGSPEQNASQGHFCLLQSLRGTPSADCHVVEELYSPPFIFASVYTCVYVLKGTRRGCLMWDFPLYAVITINE